MRQSGGGRKAVESQSVGLRVAVAVANDRDALGRQGERLLVIVDRCCVRGRRESVPALRCTHFWSPRFGIVCPRGWDVERSKKTRVGGEADAPGPRRGAGSRGSPGD